MRLVAPLLVVPMVLVAALSSPEIACAQTDAGGSAGQAVPPIIRFAGSLSSSAGPTLVTFSLYEHQVGGEPLWTESQEVIVDSGRPLRDPRSGSRRRSKPTSSPPGAARWLGVRAGDIPEQPRVLLVSVP